MLAGRGFVCGSFGSAVKSTTSVLVWRTEDRGRTFTRSLVVGQAANLDRTWLAAERHSTGVVHVVGSKGVPPDSPPASATPLHRRRADVRRPAHHRP